MELIEAECPRCAQSSERRKRDHKTKHAPDCPRAGRKGTPALVDTKQAVNAIVAASSSAELPANRESAKRITQQVREGLMDTFEQLGGSAALLLWAQENPSTFFQMWARAVPRESEALNRGAGVTVVVNTASEIRARGRTIDVTTQ